MKSFYQLTRLLFIVRKIKSDFKFSKNSLLQSVNTEFSNIRGFDAIDKRTLERDIKILREHPFNMKILLKGLYTIEDSDFDGLDIEQILEPFDILNAIDADAGLQDIIITEKYTKKGTEPLYTIINAIRKTERIAFDYGKYNEDEVTERVLEPYAIKLLKGQWYVVGKGQGETDVKTFGLDRIHNLYVRQKFKKDTSLDVRAKFEYSYGIYSDESYQIENVVLSFDKADGNYLKTVPLHHSQEVIEETESNIILKLSLRITEDFVMALMSRSWSLKVIEPISLKTRLREIYGDALARNL